MASSSTAVSMCALPFVRPPGSSPRAAARVRFRRSWRGARAQTSIPRVPTDSKRQRIAAYGVARDDRRTPAAGAGLAGPHPARSLVPPRWRRPARREPARLAAPGDGRGVRADGHAWARSSTSSPTSARIPDGTSLHTVRLIYRVDSWEGTLRPEVGRDDRRRRMVHARRDPGHASWRSTSRPWWTGCCERARRDRPAAPRRDHRLRLRRAVRSPRPQARAGPCDAHRPHEPPPLPAAPLPGGHRHPLGGPDRARDPGRAAELPLAARRPGRGGAHRRGRPPGARRRVRHGADDRLRQPHRGRRRARPPTSGTTSSAPPRRA